MQHVKSRLYFEHFDKGNTRKGALLGCATNVIHRRFSGPSDWKPKNLIHEKSLDIPWRYCPLGYWDKSIKWTSTQYTFDVYINLKLYLSWFLTLSLTLFTPRSSIQAWVTLYLCHHFLLQTKDNIYIYIYVLLWLRSYTSITVCVLSILHEIIISTFCFCFMLNQKTHICNVKCQVDLSKFIKPILTC